MILFFEDYRKWLFIFFTPSLAVQFVRSQCLSLARWKVGFCPAILQFSRTSPEGNSTAKYDPVPKSTVVTVHPLAALPYLYAYDEWFYFYSLVLHALRNVLLLFFPSVVWLPHLTSSDNWTSHFHSTAYEVEHGKLHSFTVFYILTRPPLPGFLVASAARDL